MMDLQSMQTVKIEQTEYTDARAIVHTVTHSVLLSDDRGLTPEQILATVCEILRTL